MGYSLGKHAPARCTPVLGCPVVGDSLKEPYIVTHNLILAHAAAATLYKKEFKVIVKLVGIFLFAYLLTKNLIILHYTKKTMPFVLKI